MLRLAYARPDLSSSKAASAAADCSPGAYFLKHHMELQKGLLRQIGLNRPALVATPRSKRSVLTPASSLLRSSTMTRPGTNQVNLPSPLPADTLRRCPQALPVSADSYGGSCAHTSCNQRTHVPVEQQYLITIYISGLSCLHSVQRPWKLRP